MFSGDRLRVPEPLCNNAQRVFRRQFRLPEASKILEELGPRFHPGPFDDPFTDRAKVTSSKPWDIPIDSSSHPGREFPLKTGFADYMLYADSKAIGVVEAKPKGYTLNDRISFP